MQRARALENSREAQDRGAELSGPRSTPLTLVAGAVAGENLESVASTVARALDCPVAIAIPQLGDPVVVPPGSLACDQADEIGAHAASVILGENPPLPPILEDAVAVRIGARTVGIVAAASAEPSPAAGREEAIAERRSWLEAAAAAASVTALIGDSQGIGDHGSSQALLAELAAGAPADLPGFLARTRRVGVELAAGAVAICARRDENADPGTPPAPTNAGGEDREIVGQLQAAGTLAAALRPGRILAMVPVGSPDGGAPTHLAEGLAATLRAHGLTVAVSGPRRDVRLLHQALHEAELLVELTSAPDLAPPAQEETYRLLIRVLLRDSEELQQLRDQTISSLADYDARHDTELLATLMGFLTHDGSTTETAEAMRLHRHTVGYRLSRVHEVSGLSPYESDGRERLSLGIKAHQILEADRRRGSASLTL
jgi:hypothetical protein